MESASLKKEKKESTQLDLLHFISKQVIPVGTTVPRRKSKLSRISTRKKVAVAGIKAPVRKSALLECLNPSKTLQNYFSGSENKGPVALAQAIIESPGTKYPFVYYVAPSGLGKSHLLHAMANQLLGKTAETNVLLLSGREFADRLKKDQIKAKDYQVILIDDFDVVAICSSLQEKFCTFFDEVKLHGVQLVMAGTVLPVQMKKCSDKFQTRMTSSVIQKIMPLGRKLALDVIDFKLNEYEMELCGEVKDLVATGFNYHVYGLESALLKLKSFQDICDETLNVTLAIRELKSLGQLIDYRDNSSRIIGRVAKHYKITAEELCGKSRKHEFTQARHLTMYILKEQGALSVMKIAELFERDHSSVVYAISKISKMLEEDKSFVKIVHQLS